MDLDRSLAERDIERALVRFARAMDERDWATLAALMTADVTADLGAGPLDGPDAVIALIRRHLDVCGPTQHLLANLLVDVGGDGASATSRCYVHDLHLGPPGRETLTFATLGDYHDRWRREDGRWRLCARTKTMTGYTGTLDVFRPEPAGPDLPAAGTPPRVDAAEAVFHHVDDIDWTPVQRQRNADGSESVVREKWPIIRPGFLSAYVHYEPGMVVRRHGHRSNHVVFVLGGGGWLGGEWCRAGTHVHVPLGAAFGPIVAGPEGLTCWELSFGEFGGWGDRPELYEREIRTRGVTPLPDPPLDLGDWFHDPRGDWGGERGTPKVEGLHERVTRLDELPWAEVVRRANADGSWSTIRTKLPIATAGFRSAWVEHDPGAVTARHGRHGRHLVFVVDGGGWFGDRWCAAGTHVEVPLGAAIGPVVAGPTGMRLLELTDGDSRVWEDRPAG